MAADAIDVVRLPRRPDQATARKAGVTLAKLRGTSDVLIAAGNTGRISEIALGLALCTYGFGDHKSEAAKKVVAKMKARLTQHVIKPKQRLTALDYNPWGTSSGQDSTWDEVLEQADLDNAISNSSNSVVATATKGADKTKFASWTWASIKNKL